MVKPIHLVVSSLFSSLLPSQCLSLATPSLNTPKGYKVCTSSPCATNGSELLLEALQSLATSDTTIKEEYCLGGCCSGCVIKPISGSSRKQTMSTISDESTALQTAQSLLEDVVDGLNQDKWKELSSKIAAGERALEKSNDPEICQNCGVGLQLYRGNCAKCGKYPY
mmetsp:Transcript_14222/g.21018  ORF Transcript_14222/g.21018 Transcript_14222/m.21018 type:complete len:167 (+) Transcript_14222:122-622(+)